MSIQKVPDKSKHYAILFDHSNKEFAVEIVPEYKDNPGTLKAVNEAIDFWKSCNYIYKQ